MQALRRRAVLAAFTVAALDGAFAVTLCRARNAACTPGGVFRSIASAVLGPSAKQGGLGGALAGVGVHLLVASAWTVLFLFVYMRSAALQRVTSELGPRLLAAVCYGMAIWLMMDLVIIPLSGGTGTPTSSPSFWYILAGHPLFVGLPIVTLVRTRPLPGAGA